MTMLPVKETMNIRHLVKVTPIFSAVEALGQFGGCVPFIVVFTFSEFLFPLLRSRVSVHLVGSFIIVTLFMF